MQGIIKRPAADLVRKDGVASVVPRLGKVVVKFRSGVIPMGGGGGAGGGEGGGGGCGGGGARAKYQSASMKGPGCAQSSATPSDMPQWQQGMHSQSQQRRLSSEGWLEAGGAQQCWSKSLILSLGCMQGNREACRGMSKGLGPA